MNKKEKKTAKRFITLWIAFLMVIAMSIIGVNFGAYPKMVCWAWIVLIGVNFLCWQKSMKDIEKSR